MHRLPIISMESFVCRRPRVVWALAMAGVLALPAAASAQNLIISEFRLRGPAGAQDEFIEIYNNSSSNHTVAAISGTGYGVAASDGVTRCSIPNGTVIPARGHYLCVNSGTYSLGSYPAGNGTTATGDATYTTDIPDNAGIAIFNNNTGGGSYSLANRLDAVGSTSEANTLYKEGAGYPALTPFSIDYSWTRKFNGGCTGSGSGGSGNCSSIALIQTTPGATSVNPVDTNNNANDFFFVDTNGTSAGGGQRLGAPGPQNLSAPIPVDGVALQTSRLDPCGNSSQPPNLVRDYTSNPATNSTFGRLDIRRTFTNASGAPITRLRFRVIDITTFPSISGVADFRPITSTDVVEMVDGAPCGSGTTDVTVRGTTLEQPPSQPNGSGFNGSLGVSTVSLATPLAAGASVSVRFLLGIQQTGAGRFCAVAETLPATSGQIFCVFGETNASGTFANAAAITIPGTGTSGPAAPYPSSIAVSGITGTVTKVTVTLKGISHTFPDDIDVLLVGPTGVKLILMSDVGGSADLTGETYKFDSTAAALLADGSLSPSGVYRPSNYGTGDTFGAPAPAGPYLSPAPSGTDSLTAFNGLNPNGTWSLYVTDDVGGDIGAFASGWEVNITTSNGAVTSDYNRDHTTDRAVFRPSTGFWFIEGQAASQFGLPGDIPVAGDYDGDGETDRAVFRPSSATWFVENQGGIQWGLVGDIPVPGDYNGAGSTERAVYRPSTGTWYVYGQAAVQWGLPGDIPVPGDYNGDLTTDFAVYRPSTGTWYVNGQAPVQFGLPGDTPVAGDYNGDGVTDLAVWRPSTGVWYVNGQGSLQWGLPGDIPVPDDYNVDGVTDRAVYRPSNGTWYVQGQGAVVWGAAGDLPVPRPEPWGDLNWDGTTDAGGYLGDFDGNGSTDLTVFRNSTGTWYSNGQAPVQWGLPGDIPVPGDYNGDGTTNRAVYRPQFGIWYLQGIGNVTFGLPGDIPVPGDYNGDGITDIAVYRPSTATWFVQGWAPIQWGLVGDIPVPGDYTGDGATDIAVYRPSNAVWFVQGQAPVQWGLAGDIAVPGDYNGDNITDIAVYRPAFGNWYVRNGSTVQWGLPGDIPVPGDYNGDGVIDRAVFRVTNGTWYVQGWAPVQWGIAGDIPASRVYVPRSQ